MNKPITLMRQEFIENVVKTVNESKLPLIIIEPVMRNLLNEIQKSLKQQIEADRTEYERYLAEQKKIERRFAETQTGGITHGNHAESNISNAPGGI